MRQFPEHLLAKRILVSEDQVMHVPELATGCGKLGRFGGGLGVWMYFSQREVSKDKPQLFSKLLLKRFDDRVCMSTVRAFVVAVFNQMKSFWLPRTVLEADFLVSMPKIKAHHGAAHTILEFQWIKICCIVKEIDVFTSFQP
jgi:Domain of unknown function (DUF362)